MGHYRSNLRDIEFTLFEVLGRSEVLGTGPYTDLDPDTARSILAEVERLATHELAESFTDGDRNPPIFDPVRTRSRCPSRSRRATRPTSTPSGGGWTCPRGSAGRCVRRRCAGPSPSSFWAPTPASTCTPRVVSMAHVVWMLGTETQRAYAQRMIDGRWGATMVLTEPDAGPTWARDVRSPTRNPTAPGISRASSGSSPRPSTTSPRTSSTSCWPGQRPPTALRSRPASAGRARRACRCSSCPSTSPTRPPASSANATASSSPTSRRRWA